MSRHHAFRLRLLPAVSFAILVSACASAPTKPPVPGTPSHSTPSHSTARLAIAHVTAASGSLVSGTLRLVPIGSDVHATGAIGGLTPGSRHGLHVHAAGDCSAADASAAGEVFLPALAIPAHSTRHPRAIAGSDIVAGADGVARVDMSFARRSLGGGAADDIAGRAIVVHALPDAANTAPQNDLRIGCGVIDVVPAP